MSAVLFNRISVLSMITSPARTRERGIKPGVISEEIFINASFVSIKIRKVQKRQF
jgi:hypothetical protein